MPSIVMSLGRILGSLANFSKAIDVANFISHAVYSDFISKEP